MRYTSRKYDQCNKAVSALLLSLALFVLVASFSVTASCSKSALEGTGADGCNVAIAVRSSCDSGETRTHIAKDGISVNWDENDCLTLWAKDNKGVFALNAKEFKMFGIDNSMAIFTSTLASDMKDGEYSYYACYPRPQSVSGTVLDFKLPSLQSGSISGGEDIMVSGPTTYGPLRTFVSGSHSELSMKMDHIVHVLKFYLSEDDTMLRGEKINRIEFTMPDNIAGIISKDIASSGDATLKDGTSKITVAPPSGLAKSNPGRKEYACAAIFPSGYSGSDKMSITVYTDNWVGKAKDISLNGRYFKAGHTTDVRMQIISADSNYHLNFKLDGNNLGENVNRITLTIKESGYVFGDGGSNTYIWEDDNCIETGSEISFNFASLPALEAMGGKTVNVTYDSEHARCTGTVVLPDLKGQKNYTASLCVPYLLEEDFSSVPSFSYDDEYSTSNVGNKSGHSFLNGWSGARIGASAGKCIRIAGRRECGLYIDEHYPARVDSAPIAEIKSPVNIRVTFDYGTDNRFTSIPASGDVGQYIHIGYVTKNTVFDSNASDGVFENTITSDDKGGSWNNTPSRGDIIIGSLPAGKTNRITFRNDPKGLSNFGSNTTSWCYIDNIKIQIHN